MEPTGPNGPEELSYEEEQLQLILFNEMKEQNEKKAKKEKQAKKEPKAKKEKQAKKEPKAKQEMKAKKEPKAKQEMKAKQEIKAKQEKKIVEERRFKDEQTKEYLESLKIDEARNKLTTVLEGVSVGVEQCFDEVTVEEMRRVRLLRFQNK